MSGKRSRDKGMRMEREVVNALLEAGISAERVPLSGAAGGSYTGDLTFAALGEDWTGEVKSRASGFSQLYDWLGSNDALFVRRDRDRWLVVIPFDRLERLLRAASPESR